MTMRTSIGLKVCGMRDYQNIRAVSALEPDYLGFIFYEKSPRFVGLHYSMPEIPAAIKKVGVFVDADPRVMANMVKKYKLDYLQLHGSENSDQVKALKDTGVGIFKVFSVDEHFDFASTKPYVGHADFFLFDTKGKYYGGNAMRFDWTLLQRYDQRVPFLLSGGLTTESISQIKSLEGMNLHAIDVNSGVEIKPAVKDVNKVREVQRELDKIKVENKAL